MHELALTLSATWSPFVLVTGLLLIGHVASSEGLFEWIGSQCARVSGGGVALFLVMMAAVALVTAVLNLDTSVVFMTPVTLFAARARGSDEKAFLYGTIFMSNSASLLLLGSNLTNLLIFSKRDVAGSTFAHHTLAPWAASVLITAGVVLAWRWRALRQPVATVRSLRTPFAVGPGVLGAVVAVVAMLAFSQPALWVLVTGVLAELIEVVLKRRATVVEVLKVMNPWTISLLFLVAVAVGWFARTSSLTSGLLRHANVATTILISAVTSLVVNNLPAASLFAAHRVAHPYALLLGLNLGPNLLVSGALSSLLWLRVGRRLGARTSIATFSRVGAVVTVVAFACAMPLL